MSLNKFAISVNLMPCIFNLIPCFALFQINPLAKAPFHRERDSNPQNGLLAKLNGLKCVIPKY